MLESKAEEYSYLQGLISYPHEQLDIELKGWLDIWSDDIPSRENQANLAQALLALANHGGGYILIGFDEIEGNWLPKTNGRPESLKGYNQDSINGIVHRFAEPTFHCNVHIVPHPATGDMFPVIVVPGAHRVPIRSKVQGCNNRHVQMNCYYIRRPGPKSEQIQTGQEWDILIQRCLRAAKDTLLDDIRDILSGSRTRSYQTEPTASEQLDILTKEAIERFTRHVKSLGAHEHPDRYSHGTWHFSYIVEGVSSVPKLIDLVTMMDNVERRTGWPVWVVFQNRDELRPRPVDSIVECWLKDVYKPDPSHSDYWFADPCGRFFLLRGYEDDSQQGIQPRTTLDPVLPIWRVGECLLHAQAMASNLAGSRATIKAQVTWSGLSGRKLYCWTNQGRGFNNNLTCHTDAITSKVLSVTVDAIDTGLPEAVAEILSPLYEAFSFFNMPIYVIQEELSRMKARDY